MELMLPTYLPSLVLGLTGLATGYFFVFILLSKIKERKTTRVLHPRDHRIRVLLPARPEHTNIEESAIRALMQSYDDDNFEVVVVADGLHGTTLLELQSINVDILQLDLEVKTNGNAIREALKYLDPAEADIIVVLDPDHVMEFDFLEKVNHAYNQGATAMQGHRTPKRRTPLLNRLITANEEINHAISRKGPAVLGFSPKILGTGMAFDAELLHSCRAELDGNRSFAKEMERILTVKGVKTWYLPTAKVFIERSRLSDLTKFSMPWSRLLPVVQTPGMEAKAHLLGNWMRSIMPSKLLIGLLNLTLAIYTLHPVFLASTALFMSVMLLAIPQEMYRAQLSEFTNRLPEFLRLMFKVTGGEAMTRKNILFKELPIEFDHEDRHRSTANL